MKPFLLRYKYQIALLLIGIAWIALLNELLDIKDQNVIYTDCDNYRESADFFYHYFKAHYYRPFGMAIIFGLPYLFGGDDASIYDFSFYINIASWLGTALLLFSFLKKYLTACKAMCFALLFYALLGPAFIIFHLFTESIFTFLLLLSFYFFDKHYASKSFNYLAIALGILLFTILIKPGIKFLAVVFVIYYGRVLIKNYSRLSMAFIYVAVGLIVFQCIKMKEEYGNYTISYIDGITYYNYLGAKAVALQTNTTFLESRDKRSEYITYLPFPAQRDAASKDFSHQVKTNTINVAKAYVLDMAENAAAPSDCIMVCRNLEGKPYYDTLKNVMVIISKYQNRFLSVFGCILALFYCLKTYRNPNVYTLMSLYVLYIVAICGVTCLQGDRFHMVFFPVVIILIGKFYAERTNKPVITLR